MRVFKGLLLGAAVLAMGVGELHADVVNVTASTSVIGQTTGGATVSARPGDWILGDNAGGERYVGVTFDETSYLALAQNPMATLLSAELVLNESDARNGASGTQSGEFRAFFSTEENTGWSVGMPSAGGQGGTSGTTGFFGNSQFRIGPFGGGSGPDNIDDLHTTYSSAPFAYTAATGDSFTVDLSTGISLSNIKSILADDDTANAGIFLRGTAPGQIFFNDNFALNLSFNVPTAVPEPGSLVLLGLCSAFVGVRRRRRS